MAAQSMNRTELSEIYETRIQKFLVASDKTKEEVARLGAFRLSVALGGLVLLYFWIFQGLHLAGLGFAAAIIIFIVLAKKFRNKQKELHYYQKLVKINKDEIACLNGAYKQFESGSAYIDSKHAYSYDLDIFGPSSFFQYINRTFTPKGAELLSKALTEPDLNKELIIARQASIKELSVKLDFRQHIMGISNEEYYRKDYETDIHAWLNFELRIPKAIEFKIFTIASPLFFVTLLVLSFFDVPVSPLISIFALIHLITIGRHFKSIRQYHDLIGKKDQVIKNFSELLESVSSQNFESSELIKIRETANNGKTEIKKLVKLIDWFDFRLNGLFAILANIIFFYDYHVLYRLEKWKQKNHSTVLKWFESIYEIEKYTSLANYAYNNPDAAYPEIIESKGTVFNAVGLGHPLINSAKRVSNDCDFSGRIMIVTGANMAGKSTFLRSAGINLVIAYAGAPVIASNMQCSLFHLYTGMRNADDLSESKSYFFAELQRLQKIIDALRSGKKVFLLVDEMLKGTNSDDKLSGSEGYIRQLQAMNCSGAVATHDLALGNMEMEFSNRISNYCFESTIENNELYFDYKLRKGIAQNKNATFLMKKMGII